MVHIADLVKETLRISLYVEKLALVTMENLVAVTVSVPK
jgi:hypothetical protein